VRAARYASTPHNRSLRNRPAQGPRCGRHIGVPTWRSCSRFVRTENTTCLGRRQLLINHLLAGSIVCFWQDRSHARRTFLNPSTKPRRHRSRSDQADLEFLIDRVAQLPTRKEQALKPLYVMVAAPDWSSCGSSFSGDTARKTQGCGAWIWTSPRGFAPGLRDRHAKPRRWIQGFARSAIARDFGYGSQRREGAAYSPRARGGYAVERRMTTYMCMVRMQQEDSARNPSWGGA
jgi:hypothetical protein